MRNSGQIWKRGRVWRMKIDPSINWSSCCRQLNPFRDHSVVQIEYQRIQRASPLIPFHPLTLTWRFPVGRGGGEFRLRPKTGDGIESREGPA